MRGSADVFAPVFGVLGVVLLFSLTAELFNASAALKTTTPVPAIVVRYEDVQPFSTQKPSRFGFKYPVVRYDREGKERDESIYYARVWPRHFELGQKVAIGKIAGQWVILDRWYIWQEHLLYIVLSFISVVGAVAYYLYWRPMLLEGEKRPDEALSPPPLPRAKE